MREVPQCQRCGAVCLSRLVCDGCSGVLIPLIFPILCKRDGMNLTEGARR
jgi:hypothetical protein